MQSISLQSCRHQTRRISSQSIKLTRIYTGSARALPFGQLFSQSRAMLAEQFFSLVWCTLTPTHTASAQQRKSALFEPRLTSTNNIQNKRLTCSLEVHHYFFSCIFMCTSFSTGKSRWEYSVCLFSSPFLTFPQPLKATEGNPLGRRSRQTHKGPTLKPSTITMSATTTGITKCRQRMHISAGGKRPPPQREGAKGKV